MQEIPFVVGGVNADELRVGRVQGVLAVPVPGDDAAERGYARPGDQLTNNLHDGSRAAMARRLLSARSARVVGAYTRFRSRRDAIRLAASSSSRGSEQGDG